MALDLIGQRFGRLIVNGRTQPGYGSGLKSLWICVCDCGRSINVPTNRLRLGQTKSCGCLATESKQRQRPEITTHGMTNTPEYRAWIALRSRCTNEKAGTYQDYGARGIVVCDRWKDSFENFYTDMGPRPTPDHSVERRDVNGNYDPNNCYWATRLEQMNNRRVNVFYNFQGEQLTLTQIARRIGVNVETIRSRLNRGATEEEAFR